MNAFIKACILTYVYPSRVDDFGDVIKFLQTYTKNKGRKNRTDGVYNNDKSPLEGIRYEEQV